MAKRIVETTEVISRFQAAKDALVKAETDLAQAKENEDAAHLDLEELLRVLGKPVEYLGKVYYLVDDRLRTMEVISSYDNKFVDLDKKYDPMEDDS